MTLEDYRIKQGMNYEDLAEMLEVSYSTIWRICKGAKHCISLKTAHQIVTRTDSRVFYTDLIDNMEC